MPAEHLNGLFTYSNVFAFYGRDGVLLEVAHQRQNLICTKVGQERRRKGGGGDGTALMLYVSSNLDLCLA